MSKRITRKNFEPNTPLRVVNGSYSVCGMVSNKLEVWKADTQDGFYVNKPLKVLQAGDEVVLLDAETVDRAQVAKFEYNGEVYHAFWLAFKMLTKKLN